MSNKTLSRFSMFCCMLTSLCCLYGCNGDSDGAAGPAVTNPNTTAVAGSPSSVDPTNIQSDIVGVTISSPPVITFRLLDEAGNPLDPQELIAAGGSVRFTIARLDATGDYKNYIRASTAGQPGYDAGGTFATVGNGVYTYTFATDITDSTKTLGNLAFDRALTHTVAAQIQRGEDAELQASNPYFTFRPDGGTVATTRELVAISNCNNCHGRLSVHGGGRAELALCILCHYPGIIDPETGNSVDMKSLVHKIHYGALLPSNFKGGDFTIYGFNNSVHSYKSVAYPDFSNDSTINRTPADCVKCHAQGTDLKGQPFGKDFGRYLLNPTAEKCTTCHDDVTFDGSATLTVKNQLVPVSIAARLHSGGIVTDLTACGTCHPSGTLGVDEYNAPATITGAHTILEKSVTKNTGINMDIVSVQNIASGAAAPPAITFTLKDEAGAVIPFAGNSFAFRIAYIPTGSLDYSNDLLPSTSDHTAQPFAGATLTAANAPAGTTPGEFVYTFPSAIPVGLAGTGVLTLDGRRGDIAYNTPHKGNVVNARLSGLPDQIFFDLATGAEVTDPALQRRQVVEDARCLKCHDLLRGHGGSRIAIGDCVTCHNPYAVAFGSAPATNNEAFDMKYMIHKIHTGEDSEATVPYFGDDFKEIRYPGIKGDCLACHAPDTYLLPLKTGVVGTAVGTARAATATTNNLQAEITQQLGPYESACMSCHDNPTFRDEHLAPMGGVEICTNCHGTGGIKAVEQHPIKRFL